MRNIRIAQGIVKGIDQESHEIDFVASTDWHAPDDVVIAPEAWTQDMDLFMENPVVTLFHNYHDFAAGNVTKWWIDKKIQTSRGKLGGLLARIKFAVNAWDKADTAWKLYSQRVMRAVSVGFFILAREEKTTEDGKTYILVTRARLLEIALVPVPMDAFAQAIRSRGFVRGLDMGLSGDADAQLASLLPTDYGVPDGCSMFEGLAQLARQAGLDPGEPFTRDGLEAVCGLGLGKAVATGGEIDKTKKPEDTTEAPRLYTGDEVRKCMTWLLKRLNERGMLKHKPAPKGVAIDAIRTSLDGLADAVRLTGDEVYRELSKENDNG